MSVVARVSRVTRAPGCRRRLRGLSAGKAEQTVLKRSVLRHRNGRAEYSHGAPMLGLRLERIPRSVWSARLWLGGVQHLSDSVAQGVRGEGLRQVVDSSVEPLRMHERFPRMAGHEENRESRPQGQSFPGQTVALQAARQRHVGQKQIDPAIFVFK